MAQARRRRCATWSSASRPKPTRRPVVKLFGEVQTNTYEGGQQTEPSVARLYGSNNGGYVIAWTSQTDQDGSGYGVFAQRYDAKGAAYGPEFKANSQTLGTQTDVAVSGLANGGYVLVWRADGQDGSGSYGVYGQRYAADGSKAGGEFRANTTVTSNQYQPTVLGLADGTFVVAYFSDYSNATAAYSNDVLAQRFAADGSLLGTELTLNTSGGATQSQPKLAALAGGGFAAVWTDSSGDASGNGIGARVFANDGTPTSAVLSVNTTIAGNQQGPDVAALAGGGFVVVWNSASATTYAQLYSAAGVKVGGEITVSTADTPANYDAFARVAALDSGGFIVTWDTQSAQLLGGSGLDVVAQQFDATGNKIDGPKLVNTTVASTQYVPDIVGLTGSNAVAVWAGYDQERGTPSTYGVFHQLLGTPGSITNSAAPVLVDLATTRTFAENAVNAAPQLIDTAVSLTDADSANFEGGRLWVSTISGYGNIEAAQLPEAQAAQDQFGIRNQGTGAGQISVAGTAVSFGGVVIGSIVTLGTNGGDLVVQFNAAATADAVEAVIENLTYANTSSAPVASRTVSISVSDGDGGTSIARMVTIEVTPEADGGQLLYGNEKVNTYLTGSQSTPASAALSDGGYVTVWTSVDQDGWSNGVYAQRFDAKGVQIGAEFRINRTTPLSQSDPTVVGLNGGGYVVAWTSSGQDGSGDGVYAQRFSNDGVALGNEFRVNTSTDQGQSQPSIAKLANGGFVVAWYDDYYTNASNTEYRDIFFQRYDAAGVAQGTETRANPAGEGTVGQSQPAIAGLAAGGFVTVWTDDSKDGNSYGVYGQRFDVAGTALGASFRVNTYVISDQSQPSIAALNDGGYVVAWTSNGQDGSGYGVFAQRYAANGTTVGSEFRVNTTTSSTQYEPNVTGLSNGGFVITFTSNGTTIAQQFDSTGARVDGELRLDTLDNNANASVSVAVALANGGFVVSWQDYDYTAGNTYDIYQQLVGTPASFVRQANPQLVDVASTVTFLENTVNATPQLIDPVVGLSDADSANFDGGILEVNYLTSYSLQNQLGLEGLALQDQLGIRNQGSGAGQIGVVGSTVRFAGVDIGSITSNGVNGGKLTVLFNANATVVAVERVIENLTYANTFSDPSATRTVSVRVTDGDGGASVARSIAINVTPEFDGAQPLFTNERVNTYETDTQTTPAMARLSDGSYLTVWASTGQDGWASGVYGQRYDAKGVPLGSEFAVNTYTPLDQLQPTVIGLKNGGYVVAWASVGQDGSSYGVYAQRFANDGVLQGVEFRVNSSTDQGQYQPAIAATADGGFVVAWYDDYYTNASNTEYRDVFFQRYDAAGVAQGSETRANPAGEGTVGQSEPAIVGLAAGGFVMVWTDDSKDGSSYGVYGQRFDAVGAVVGPSFRINTYTTSGQSDADITALNDGGFVVVWTSNGQDSSGYGVYAQRYSAAGVAVGGEFRVNNTTSGNQSDAQVASLSTGGFVVTWVYDGRTIAQQFDASGTRIDGELRVDTLDANNNASAPAVIGLANGAFAVAWTDYDYTATTANYNVYQQIFGTPADFVRQTNPLLVDVTPSVTFAENLVNAAPQRIDPGVGLVDPDSPDFNGGTLDVNYLTGYGAQDQLGLQGLARQDQLGIRHQGNGAGQVGVAGNVVSFGGTAIGIITSNGANGAKLTVAWNANATVDAVEHVIENLTYANTVSNPIASRTISIRLTDGDGGASDPRNVVINVTPEIDGAVRFGTEKIVNTSVAGNQSEPQIARLADGGYVVVWTDTNSNADGSSYGVYGQRYDSGDNKAGAQFRLNTYTTSDQSQPQVVGLAGGGFVAVWTSNGQDASGYGVYGQRYAADGSVAGSEFRVATTTANSQYQPTLAANPAGGFVVAWYHDNRTATETDYYDIYFQRYSAAGTALGGETRASPAIPGNQFAQQSEPSIAWLNDADGGFVVGWSDGTRDGNGTGVFAQRFSAVGVAEGAVLQLNSFVTGAQGTPSLAGLKDGGFVAVWNSEGQDLSSTGVYAQRFDAAGAKVGGEFRVNTTINSTQNDPAVTALENGGWAVTWYDANTSDVYVQQYNVLGLQVDGETLVNTYRYSTQNQPSITSMADGGFVVSYAGYIASGDGNGDGAPDGGNDTYEIRLQRFSNTAPNVSNVSVSGNEEAVITLTNTLFEGGFVDPDGQSLQAIKIITLPAEGLLRLNGVLVTPGQEIGLADLQAGALTYQGRVDYFGTDQFQWTGSDGISFAPTSVFTNIVLANVNDGPRLGIISDTTGSEGSAISRTLVIGDPDPEGHRITVAWGDGSANTVFTTSSANPGISHAYADNGSYTATVTVDDQQGQANSIESASFNVAIANVAPTIALFGDTTVTELQPFVLRLGGVVDPGRDTVTEYRIDWGDNSAVQVVMASSLPSNRNVTHTFATAGEKAISVTLVDEDGVFANAGRRTVTVEERPDFATQLVLPTSLAPGEEGVARLNYSNVSGEDQDGILVLVKAQTALLRDPLTGEYVDSLLLIGRGNGQGVIGVGEAGVLDFVVKQANVPLGSARITVSIVDADAPFNTAGFGAALRPAFLSDATWQRIYTNFAANAGSSTQALIDALASNSALIAGLGAEGSSGAAALRFELEQSGDFGSLAERMTQGSLGNGWAFIGDVRLDVDAEGNVAWRGSADLNALLTLEARSAAYYTVSSSVGISVGLNGTVRGAAAPNRPVFTKNIDGSFDSTASIDGTLTRTAGGYEFLTLDGMKVRFDSAGRLQEVISPMGRSTDVTRDAQGRISGFSADFGNTLGITRDAQGRAIALVDEYGTTTTLTYDNSRLAGAEHPGGSSAYVYGTQGDLVSTTPTGGPAAVFQYDAQGRLAGMQVAGQSAGTVVYDSEGGYTWTAAEGQQTRVELAPGGAASAVAVAGITSSELVYDAGGKLVGVQLANGSQLHFDIDDAGRLTSIVDPTGATVSYAYDGASTRPSSFTDAGGSTRDFSYDGNGRLLQATWDDGSVLRFNYDAQGQISGYSNRRGDATSYDYDMQGRLTGRTEAGGETHYGYDSLGRVASATTGYGTVAARTTQIGYDAASHVTSITYADGRSLAYAYDDAGRRTAMTDQDGNIQSYAYSATGRLASVGVNGNQIVGYTYDGDGRPVREANGNGTATAYTYDARGLLSAIVNLAPDGSESSAYRYNYDAAGQRTGMQTPHGDWAYGYDGAGQLTAANFTVNAAGTAAGLANTSLAYAYDAAGNRTSLAENGVATAYVSNALNQYTQVGATSYTYDKDGNQISKTIGSDTWDYTYNAANRLEKVEGPQGQVTQYEYDVFGNRSAVIENGVRTEFLVDPFALGMGSPVAEYSGGQRVASYYYGLDAIAQQSAGGTHYFEGDAVGSVTGLTGAGGTLANSYEYDPFGRQMLETETVANRLEFNGLFGVEESSVGLSFMRARFYDAEQGRFTSEDPLWLRGDVSNLYRFAGNSPLDVSDPSGLLSLTKIGEGLANVGIGLVKFVGAGIIVAGAVVAAAPIVAAVGGLVAGSGLGALALLTITDGAVILGAAAASIGFIANLPGAQQISDGYGDILEGIGLDDELQEFIDSLFDTPRGASDGDPHLRTFDGLSYDFQAAGEFVLARGTGLEIQTRQEAFGSSTTVSINTAVAIRLGDSVVGLYKGQPSPLNINGQFVQIASGETVAVGGGSVYRSGTAYIVTNAAGDGFWANVQSSHINVRAFIGNDRGTDVEGLLGNHDGNITNDLALADGTPLPQPVPVTRLYGEYADSWRVTDATSLFVYGSGQSTATYTNRSFPSGIITLNDLDPVVRAAAEQIARDAGLIPGTWAFVSAVLDIALTGVAGFGTGAAAAPVNNQPEPTPVVVQLAPVLAADAATTREDEAVTINVLANDSDPENDPLVIVGAADATGGVVQIVGGQLVFTPRADFNGNTQLTYTVSDGAGNLVSSTVAVNVEAVNDAPRPAPDQYSVGYGATLEVSAAAGLLANDRDPDGDQIAVIQAGVPANGSVEVSADGSFRYTPNAGFSGIDTIAYTVGDGTLFAGSTFTITVGNAAPILSIAGASSASEGRPYELSISATDPNGTALSFNINWGDGSALQTLTAAQLAALAGNLTHVYADDQDGPVNATPRTISVTANDGDGGITTQTKVVSVNNVAPTIALAGAGGVQVGQSYALTLGNVTDPGQDTVTSYLVNWGDGSAVQSFNVAGIVTHTFTATGNLTISVALVDEDGSFANAGSLALAVSASTPTVAIEAGPDATVAEGSAFTRTIVFSDGDDNGSAGWDFTVDYGDGTIASGRTFVKSVTLNHVYADGDAARNVSVTVTDVAGETATDGFVVNVTNVAPTAAVSGADSVAEGSVYTLSVGTVVDPGADTRTGYSIDWGDGNSSSFTPAQWAAAAGAFSHVYADGGPALSTAPTIVVRATDEDGSFVLGTKSITVANVAPTVTLGGAAATDEGAVFTLAIAAADPAGAADVLSYTIDWGDGSAVQALSAAQLAALAGNVTHVFADDQDGPVNATPRTISVTVDDGDGGVTTATRSVTVNNVAPTVALAGAASVAEGSVYTLTVGAVADPGNDTRTGYSIDWGDGSTAGFTVAQWAAAAGSFSHVYADGAAAGATTPTIVVRTTDEDGTFVIGSKTLTVTNVAPSVALGGSAVTHEGATYVLTVIASDPAGAADPLTYTIDWGDGSALQTLSAAQMAALQGNVAHVYADDQDGPVNATARTISVSADDGDGGVTTATKGITVNNVAPTAALTGSDTVNEGSVYTLGVGTVVEPGQDTRTSYSIDWDDGNVSSFTAAQWAAAGGSFTHLYADGAAAFSIVVSATDEDGSFVLGTKAITVANVAPSVVLAGNANTNEGSAYTLNIVGSDPAGAADPLNYSIDWGDGSAVQTLTAAQLTALSGNVTHVFADDQDGPVNSTPRTISVTANDGDGGITTQTKVVNVDNVAPTIALIGAGGAQVAQTYTLTLGAVTDPGQDTVTSYLVNWGDGSAVQTYSTAGAVTHTFNATGNLTIAVSVVDEDGSFAAGTLGVNVSASTPTVSLEAGPNAALNEGSLFTRTIAFSDGADNGAPGWSYTIDYGDGTTFSGTTLVQSISLSHVYADGNAANNVTVTVTDVAGETASDGFTVNVVNVAPTAAVSGANTVNEGNVYTLAVGTVVDPGQDTISGYSIAWGDGNTSSFTAAQWALAAGSFAHVYADGAATPTITVSATDEDGTFVLGTKSLMVANVAPTVLLAGNANTNEGSTYTLNIVGSDPAGAADPLNYSIDWGDGSAIQTLTAAQLTALSGNVTHVFADDQDGPVNSTPRTIAVTANDGDGGITTTAKVVNVDNVAPTIALGGSGNATVGQLYTLNLGSVTDPGQDTVTNYLVNWGDGSAVQSYSAAGNVTHAYGSAGNVNVSVSVVDEDGTFAAGSQLVHVGAVATTTLRIGDAPARQTSGGNQWAKAWSDPEVAISHTANNSITERGWTPVNFDAINPQLLSGGDIYGGDLGVSGQTAATSRVQQEIDGSESLRFVLTDSASAVTVNLSRFYLNDDGGVLAESGRLRLLDAAGHVVGETTFQAGSASGMQQVSLTATQAFNSVELTAGVYNGSTFVFGGYGDGHGGFGSGITTDGTGQAHGSDYLVDWIEFTFPAPAAPLIGVTDLTLEPLHH